MLRGAAIVTLFCFLTVGLLGNVCGLLCVRICQAETAVAADEPDEPACGSCCGSKSSCGEEKKPQKCQPGDPLCGSMDCPEIPPGKGDCEKCFMPRMDFTLVENKSHSPVMALKEAPDPGGKIDNHKRYVFINNPRLRGVHPCISSTVLLI